MRRCPKATQGGAIRLKSRGRHLKHYSVIVIKLSYVFALSHNASTLRRKVIASYSNHSRLIEIVIVLPQQGSLLLLTVIAL
jgi:hypothetical protein